MPAPGKRVRSKQEKRNRLGQEWKPIAFSGNWLKLGSKGRIWEPAAPKATESENSVLFLESFQHPLTKRLHKPRFIFSRRQLQHPNQRTSKHSTWPCPKGFSWQHSLFTPRFQNKCSKYKKLLKQNSGGQEEFSSRTPHLSLLSKSSIHLGSTSGYD